MGVKLKAGVVKPTDALLQEKENAVNVYFDAKKANVIVGKSHPINQHTDDLYKPEYAGMAYNYLASIADNCRAFVSPLALFFEVSASTIRQWTVTYPEFMDAINDGLKDSNHKILNKLRRAQIDLAVGCVLPETKVFCHKGQIVIEDVEKHYTPSQQAIEALKYELDPEYRALIDKKESANMPALPIAVTFGVADASIDGLEDKIKAEMESEE